eukprot:ANDGO_06182.mRNA.1 Putative white-brown complex homolog protein 30
MSSLLYCLACVALMLPVFRVNGDPYVCPGGMDCYGQQVCSGLQDDCTDGLYCPGFNATTTGVIISGHQADLCPKGYYCPSPVEKHDCPSGHFCPRGTSSPRSCAPFSLCPSGAGTQFQYMGLVLGILIPTIFLIAFKSYVRIRDRKRGERDTRRTQSQYFESADPLVETVEDPALQGLTVQMEGVNISIEGKRILTDFSTEFKGKRCTCIMGPSGSGKTTVLNAILGRLKPESGKIFVNGTDVSAMKSKDVRCIGFVPQVDTMIRTLTPKETLLYCSAYRLSDEYSTAEREQIVNDTLRELHLWHVRHVIIGDPEIQRGISGGQRKRVNIGIELVGLNPILLLDEPTSGLDATCAQEVSEALQGIAAVGRLVVAVIHQPRTETFFCFDDLVLLAKGGYLAYSGPVSEAVNYFRGLGFQPPPKCNPADFLIDVVCGKASRSDGLSSSPEQLAQSWKEHSYNAEFANSRIRPESAVAAAQLPYRAPPSTLRQVLVFCRRTAVQTLRDLRSLAVASFIQLLGGFMIGGASSPNRVTMFVPPVSGAIASNQCPFIIRDRCENEPLSQIVLQVNVFYLSMACGVGAISRAVSVFGEEKAVIKREVSTGRSTLAYFLSRNLVDIPIVLYSTLLFCGVFVAFAQPSGSFASFFLAFFVMQFAACGLGYFISLVTSDDKSMVISIVSSIVFAMCCGFHPTLKDVRRSFSFLQGLWDLSYARWAGEAIYITEVSPFKDDFNLQGGYDLIGYNPDNYVMDICLTVALGIFWRLASYIVLIIQGRKA